MSDQEIKQACLALDQQLEELFRQALSKLTIRAELIARLWFDIKNPGLKIILRQKSPELLSQLSSSELTRLWLSTTSSELRQLINNLQN